MSPESREDQLNEDQQRLSARIRSHLDDSLQDYDAATLSRLNQARQRALDALPARRARAWQWPGLGLAATLALVLMIGIQRQPPAPAPASVDAGLMSAELSDEELALLASDDDLEMFQDLEFYAWLEQQQDWDGSSS